MKKFIKWLICQFLYQSVDLPLHYLTHLEPHLFIKWSTLISKRCFSNISCLWMQHLWNMQNLYVQKIVWLNMGHLCASFKPIWSPLTCKIQHQRHSMNHKHPRIKPEWLTLFDMKMQLPMLIFANWKPSVGLPFIYYLTFLEPHLLIK